MNRPRRCRTFAVILIFSLLGSCLLMGSEGESKKRKKAHETKATETKALEEQLKTLQDQLNQQQSAIKDQQDKISNLQQQLQTSSSQLQQQSGQTQQLQDAVKQADQKATAAQETAAAANSSVTAVKAETAAVSQSVKESQNRLDRLLNPEKYLPVPTVVQAIAPVRVLAVDAPKRDGLVPAFRIGAIRVTPYGFIKSTAVEDSSSPRGDDFPLPGFLNADTGPNPNPEFHLKARSTRLGSNFEWPDISRRLILTGRVEGDFEGNFSRVDNRNVSSIRSSAFQLRLAYARLDYAVSDKTDIFFEGGQNWTIFGSSLLPNLLETTGLAVYFGDVYERSPQFRLGVVRNMGGSRKFTITPEVAIMMPSEGNLPADSVTCTVTALATPTSCTFVNGLGNQLGYGERQGADSNRPEFESRLVVQWQLDKAPGVAPAQLVVSGFSSRREAVVTHASEAAASAALPASYLAAFPRGVTNSSDGYGIQVGGSLPTRWATLTVSAYQGADLRFFFGGQLLSNYNDTAGLTGLHSVPSVDASSTVVFGTNAAGTVVVAPQRSVRGYGGFAELGFPLSRWFHADPAGHNAGWQLFLHAGIDQAKKADFIKAKEITINSAGPQKSTLGAATLYYKFNRWCQFAFEQSVYQSYALPNLAGVYTATTSVAGHPQQRWRDNRSEFGPIFTF